MASVPTTTFWRALAPGAAEMSQATVSRAVADETQFQSFERTFSLPESCRSFISTD